ncbi:MAG: YbaN family protein [Xanthobacteraceae bacterium]|nr:YbaN family protein [Xanthobacteraceae bacterium]
MIAGEQPVGPARADASGAVAAKSRLTRGVFLALGVGFVALGFIGAFLPVLPTTPFLILAAGCFARSSPRLERRLLDHPRFGPLLREWRARGAIPMKAKLMSLGGMALGFALFWFGGHPGPWLTAAVALLILVGLAYVFSRPS